MRSRAKDPLDLPVALRFLKGLKRNNDRAWFHAHKADWDGSIRHGWEDLVTMLLLETARFDDRLRGVDPKRCLFRLANDTRFHTGKAPYKTHLAAWLSPGGKSGAYAGYYVQVAPGRAHFSAGIYVPEKPALRAIRTAFAEDGAVAKRFDRILATKSIRPYLPLETEPLRVMPPGFAKTHPRAELIRARNYLIARDTPESDLVQRGAFALFRDCIRDAAPFVRWLDDRATAGPPQRPADEPTDEELWG